MHFMEHSFVGWIYDANHGKCQLQTYSTCSTLICCHVIAVHEIIMTKIMKFPKSELHNSLSYNYSMQMYGTIQSASNFKEFSPRIIYWKFIDAHQFRLFFVFPFENFLNENFTPFFRSAFYSSPLKRKEKKEEEKNVIWEKSAKLYKNYCFRWKIKDRKKSWLIFQESFLSLSLKTGDFIRCSLNWGNMLLSNFIDMFVNNR